MRLLTLIIWPISCTYALQDLLDLVYASVSKQSRVRAQKCELILDVGIVVSVALLYSSYDISLL